MRVKLLLKGFNE